MKLCENKGYLLNYSQKSVVRTNIESNDRTLPLTRQGDQKGEYVQAGLKKNKLFAKFRQQGTFVVT